ncbi:hypothetical protein P691DRAFT_155977 [Macrolepiota fuliginosa MF-IS2]|uniref:Uncharacterized protein n=1 Tax=Macrolepiota fuliginosa MF-IS2 TaxID=1400762 RepID=A0A9P5X8P9_9AGAR|nr:hypothetical protein P691DRAFT_155977 [Macrolepiota fuliginosa MF-IS2]
MGAGENIFRSSMRAYISCNPIQIRFLASMYLVADQTPEHRKFSHCEYSELLLPTSGRRWCRTPEELNLVEPSNLAKTALFQHSYRVSVRQFRCGVATFMVRVIFTKFTQLKLHGRCAFGVFMVFCSHSSPASTQSSATRFAEHVDPIMTDIEMPIQSRRVATQQTALSIHPSPHPEITFWLWPSLLAVPALKRRESSI